MNSRTSRVFIIAFPTALSTTTWEVTAYCAGFVAGDATPEGIIPFSATISIVGKPNLNRELSAGMSGLTGTEEEAGGGITIIPAIAVGTYTYTTTVNTLSDWIQLTPIAAGQTIRITVLGVEHPVVSGDTTGNLYIGIAGTVTSVYIKVYEANKSARNYTLVVTRPS